MSDYLELLKDALLNLHYLEHEPQFRVSPRFPTTMPKRERRENGADWPGWAVTMVGRKRLDNIEKCISEVVGNEVPGDFLETGVWRGGASIFARACLNQEHQGRDGLWRKGTRTVWLADSFQGCPPPDLKKWPKDKGSKHSQREWFKVSFEEVRANFARFRVPLDGVKFIQGWFEDTLPGPIEQLAVLRIDGDMYGGTMHTLRTLYDKVSPGGFIITDDFASSPRERMAVEDFWAERGIQPELKKIDWVSRYWRKE